MAVPLSLPHGRERPNASKVYVDMLSGKDGHSFWWWHVELPSGRRTSLWQPCWWGRGPDGWPLLAIGLGGRLRQTDETMPSFLLHPPIVHLLELSTGREVHTIAGLAEPRSADLDGDGLADLWGEFDGALRAYHGETPEIWRILGSSRPAADFNRDGVVDSIANVSPAADPAVASDAVGGRTVVARVLGRDGKLLWKTPVDWGRTKPGVYPESLFPLNSDLSSKGDLNGDGIPEVAVFRAWQGRLSVQEGTALRAQILSGRTGQRLWSAGPMPSGPISC